jgi:nitrogen PTS system EIIA component
MNTTTECPPARVAEWLFPDDVLLDVEVRDVDSAIAKAATHIAALHGLDPAPIVRALARREQVGSTGIGQGVALPHARIGGIARPLVLFLRAQDAIEFAAPDGRLVRLILVILVPQDGDPEEHLQLLATAAQLFCEREFRARLAQVPDAEAARTLFAEWTSRLVPPWAS